MRVYCETGVFIDYISVRFGSMNAPLKVVGAARAAAGRTLLQDAKQLFERTQPRTHSATSCLTYYEVEEALYRALAHAAKGFPRADTLLIPAARLMMTQVQIVIELFNVSVLDLTPGTVRLQLQQLDLQTRGIRAADALHAASAMTFDADLLVSTDEAVLHLDEVLTNTRGHKIICRDTDSAFTAFCDDRRA